MHDGPLGIDLFPVFLRVKTNTCGLIVYLISMASMIFRGLGAIYDDTQA